MMSRSFWVGMGLAMVLVLAVLALSGCRFAVVETGEVVIEAVTQAPGR